MAFVIAMCVIETEYAPFVGTEPMWQEEGEIVSNHLILLIDPDLFTKNADSAGTPKTSFVIGVLAKTCPPTHGKYINTDDAYKASSASPSGPRIDSVCSGNGLATPFDRPRDKNGCKTRSQLGCTVVNWHVALDATEKRCMGWHTGLMPDELAA